MKTFLKILLIIAAAWVVAHLLPILIVPLLVVGVILLGIGSFAAGGVALVAGLGLTVVGLLAVIGMIVFAVLAPIWIPVLLVVSVLGLFSKICRRLVA